MQKMHIAGPAGETGILEPAAGIEPASSITATRLEGGTDTRAIRQIVLCTSLPALQLFAEECG